MRRRAGTAEMLTGRQELRDAERHTHARRHEADAPTVSLREPRGDQRSDEGADVDAHVEDREAGVPTAAALGIQVGDQRRDVRLEQADAEDDDDQAEIEHRGVRRQPQAETAEGDEDAAVQHGFLGADQPVGDPAAGQRDDVHRCGVEAVDRGRRLVVQAEAAARDGVDQEQHQQGAHAVEAEAFPHLGEEQRGEAARVAEKGLTRRIVHGLSPGYAECARSRGAAARQRECGAGAGRTAPSGVGDGLVVPAQPVHETGHQQSALVEQVHGHRHDGLRDGVRRREDGGDDEDADQHIAARGG